jgi:hypothetical protein
MNLKKKLLALILTLAMLIGLMIPFSVVPVSAARTNLLPNGDFSNPVFGIFWDSWHAWWFGWDDGIPSYYDTETFADEYGNVLVMPAGGGKNLVYPHWLDGKLEEGKNYEISVTYYRDVETATPVLRFGYGWGWGSIVDVGLNTIGEWVTESFPFTMGPGYAYFDGGTEAWSVQIEHSHLDYTPIEGSALYIAEVSITEVGASDGSDSYPELPKGDNLIINGSFTSPLANGWLQPWGDGVRWQVTVWATGGYAARFGGNGGIVQEGHEEWNGNQFNTNLILKPNTQYMLAALGKFATPVKTGNVYLKVSLNSKATIPETEPAIPLVSYATLSFDENVDDNDTWTLLSQTFTTDDENLNTVLGIAWNWSPDFYLDSVYLVEVPVCTCEICDEPGCGLCTKWMGCECEDCPGECQFAIFGGHDKICLCWKCDEPGCGKRLSDPSCGSSICPDLCPGHDTCKCTICTEPGCGKCIDFFCACSDCLGLCDFFGNHAGWCNCAECEECGGRLNDPSCGSSICPDLCPFAPVGHGCYCVLCKDCGLRRDDTTCGGSDCPTGICPFGILGHDLCNCAECDECGLRLSDPSCGSNVCKGLCPGHVTIVFSVPVKSMAVKVGQSPVIPVNAQNVTVTYKTSNAAICDVLPNGTLVPKKAGIAVITITAPGYPAVAVTVTVSN